jgi:hypothetical protein
MLPAWMTTTKPTSLLTPYTWPAKKELTTVSFAELSDYSAINGPLAAVLLVTFIVLLTAFEPSLGTPALS